LVTTKVLPQIDIVISSMSTARDDGFMNRDTDGAAQAVAP
jgi:hypothetical protein